jgi:hypothetical protein
VPSLEEFQETSAPFAASPRYPSPIRQSPTNLQASTTGQQMRVTMTKRWRFQSEIPIFRATGMAMMNGGLGYSTKQ